MRYKLGSNNFGNRKIKLAGWLLGCMLVVLGGALAFKGFNNNASNNNKQANLVESTQQKPKIIADSITSHVLFTGDVYWGRYMKDWSQASSLKTAYPFSRLNEFGRDKYNAWIGDLECPTVSGVNMTSAEEDNTLSFNCDPSYLPQLAKWFNIMSLANNHTDNQGGQEGLDTTRAELDKVKVQYFGHFDPDVLDDVCETVSLPVTVHLSDKTTKKGDLPLAMCGHHGVFKIPSVESVAVIDDYQKYFPTIAYPHSGAEYKAGPDEIKTNLYRAMIDSGADVVLGNHPHWIQNTEAYKGHLIVYSMGNFMFDQQYSTEVTRSAAINLNLATGKVSSDLLGKWLALGSKCKNFRDDCLATAKSENLKKLDFKWDFGIVGTRDDGRLTHPADPGDQASILQCLQWPQTIKGLQAPYSGHI